MPAVLIAAALVALLAPLQELVVVRERGKEYHRPGCAAVRDGKGVLAMSKGEAEARGLKPHAGCDPANPRNAPPKPPPVVHVYVDGGKHYHREKCAKLTGQPRRVTLDTAGRKHWPCPACKPPIRPRKRPGALSSGRVFRPARHASTLQLPAPG